MKQALFTALSVLMLLPAAVTAQGANVLDPQDWGPRVRIMPFAGFGPAVTSKGDLMIATGSQLTADSYEFEYASGPVAGLSMEMRLHSRFSLIASGAWSRRGEAVFQSGDSVATDAGSDFWMARLATALRLRERNTDLQFRNLGAMIFIGGAMVRERPEVLPGSAAEWQDDVTHWGIYAGAEAEVPLTEKSLALTAGFEDTMMFWNASGIERHVRRYYQSEHGAGSLAEADPNISHMFTLRVGLTFRFGQ